LVAAKFENDSPQEAENVQLLASVSNVLTFWTTRIRQKLYLNGKTENGNGDCHGTGRMEDSSLFPMRQLAE